MNEIELVKAVERCAADARAHRERHHMPDAAFTTWYPMDEWTARDVQIANQRLTEIFPDGRVRIGRATMHPPEGLGRNFKAETIKRMMTYELEGTTVEDVIGMLRGEGR